MTARKSISVTASLWSRWFYDTCTTTCGPGTIIRLRHCNTGHDEDCHGNANETVSCNLGHCPVSGAWSAWQPWSGCSRSCGDGTRNRSRSCDNPPPLYGGPTCTGAKNETVVCKLTDCPHWLPFQQAKACSVTCGKGFIQMRRKCSTGNLSDCDGSEFTEIPCVLNECL
ncbi:thrombospondin-1-like [Mercenaria mercenaria]|uniref:thrombospondin-1-like n=1 Tax=Mercenaria mercenaria TaxID=6596 RepID=UPI00234FA456|nr:thrombospondin-1-like [Mercenaria mercenaria]